ncbi:vesicle-associated membrane protein 5 [Synchiropus splendidus]|uniref:vesicle-associated membrane protein 5 n=1 Tax=Synchiropus splendidus TaxID=270530 RepID=UPI00237EBFF5|nr:vesicle-associated membrane protein 5 [Synchiropus splendidus]
MENGKSRLQQAQEEAEEVKMIMLDNMNKADERADKLGDLEEKAEELLNSGKTFEKKSNKIKEKKRWEHNKMKIVLGVVGGVILATVIGLIIFACV